MAVTEGHAVHGTWARDAATAHPLPNAPITARRRSAWLDDPETVGAFEAAVLAVCLLYVSLLVFATNGLGFHQSLALAVLATAVWCTSLHAVLRTLRLGKVAAGVATATAIGLCGGTVGLIVLALIAPLDVSVTQVGTLGILAALIGAVWTRFVGRATDTRPRVLIVGSGPGSVELASMVARDARRRCEILGFVHSGDERELTLAGLRVHGRLEELREVIARERPTLVVVAVDSRRLEVFRWLLDAAHPGLAVVDLPEFYEQTLGLVPIRQLNSAWFMSVLHLYQRGYSRLSKRFFDICISLVGLVLSAPLMPVIALLVRTTPGPAIYKQRRLGLGGAEFTIYKFRTMRIDAEASGRPAWAAVDDPRVTRLGRILRRNRLDELPQLWNVLKGDMSIVGPRPERPEYLETLSDSIPFWQSRLLVKPGITGWAQLMCGYTADSASAERKLAYDLWYVRHRSFLIDVVLCIKTMRCVLAGIGAR